MPDVHLFALPGELSHSTGLSQVARERLVTPGQLQGGLPILGALPMLVKELMKADVARCHVDSSLETLALLMWNHDCGAIPVVDSADKPIGIVTDRDIAMACSLNNRPPWDMRAGDVINGRPIFCCTEEDEVVGALELMRDYQVRRLPVTDSSEALTGVLSMSDLIQAAQKRPSRSKTVKKLSFDQLIDPLKAISAPYAEVQSTKAG